MTGMSLVHVDVAERLPEVVVPADRSGLAVIVRRSGEPVGFWMEDLPPGTALSPTELEERIGAQCGPDVLAHRLSPRSVAPPAPPVTLVVCTKDRPEGLDRTLDSLDRMLGSAAAASAVAEILVVDNASTDERVREVAAAHGARHVFEPRPGLDFARNRAVEETQTDWLAFFDDDVVVDPMWLDGFASIVADHPDAAVVTGLVLPLRLDTPAQVLFERRGGFRQGFTPKRLAQSHPHDDSYPAGAAHFGTGANMAVRVADVRALGGFDEALDAGPVMPGGGDLDLFYRVVRDGRVVAYQPNCLAFHDHRLSLEELRGQLANSWGMSFHAFISKSYRADPPLRAAHRRYLARWYRSMSTDLVRSVLGRSPIPPSLLAAEIAGAVRGTLRAYDRALRRAAAVGSASVGGGAP